MAEILVRSRHRALLSGRSGIEVHPVCFIERQSEEVRLSMGNRWAHRRGTRGFLAPGYIDLFDRTMRNTLWQRLMTIPGRSKYGGANRSSLGPDVSPRDVVMSCDRKGFTPAPMLASTGSRKLVCNGRKRPPRGGLGAKRLGWGDHHFCFP